MLHYQSLAIHSNRKYIRNKSTLSLPLFLKANNRGYADICYRPPWREGGRKGRTQVDIPCCYYKDKTYYEKFVFLKVNDNSRQHTVTKAEGS